MVKWLQVQLSDGQFAGKSLIKTPTLHEMHLLQMQSPVYPTESTYGLGYGLGWGIGIYNGHYFVMHSGAIDGFVAVVALLPKDGIGVVILSNQDASGQKFVPAVISSILDRLTDTKEVDWITKLSQPASESKETTQNDESLALGKQSLLPPAEAYIGEYEHPAYGVMKIYLENGHLIAQHNQMIYQLNPNNYDVFKGVSRARSTDSFSFQFSRNASEEVSEIHVPFETAVAPIVFKRLPTK
jgi:hypothetical protein